MRRAGFCFYLGGVVASHVLLLSFLLLCLLMPNRMVRAQQAEPATLTVVAEGMAALGDDVAGAEEEALWDAKRNAVEQAAGLFVKSHTLGSRFTIEHDDIEGRTQGFLRRWERIEGTRRIERVGNTGSRLLHLQIQAEVELVPLARRLADIADLYNDLERPRLRVQVNTETPGGRSVRDALVAELQAQHFDLADSGPAEVALKAQLTLTPTVHLGDRNAPFGVGEMVAACRARLTLQVVCEASEDVLFTAQAETSGQSFTDDAEAARDATQNAVTTLIASERDTFLQTLLAQWTRERQEGHVAIVHATGVSAKQAAALREALTDMRGFRHLIEEQRLPNGVLLRFETRLDTASLRRRLAELRLPDQTILTIQTHRGPRIACAAHRSQLSAPK